MPEEPDNTNPPEYRSRLYKVAGLLMPHGSIRNRIMAASLFIVIMPVIITGIISGESISLRAEKLYFDRMDAELSQISNLVTEIAENAIMDLEMICALPAFKKAGPGSLKIYYNTRQPTDMSRVKRGPLELQIYSFIKLMSEKHGNYVEIYAGTKYGGFVSSGDYVMRTAYDPRERPWYKDAIETPGKAVVAKSYFSTTGFNVTAVVKAVPGSSGEILYAAGIDFSLNRLSEILRKIKIGKTGYLILTEKDGTILAHPRRPELNSINIKEIGIPEIIDIIDPEKGTFNYSFEGEEKIARLITSPRTGWKLIAVIDSGEINETAFFFRIVIMLAVIIITASCVLLYYYILRGIIRPVTMLTDFGRSIAAGNLETPIVLKRDDELGRLADDFNDMMYRIRESVESIRSLIEMVPSIIIQIDTRGRVLEWNRHAQKFTGLAIEEARGGELADIKPELSPYIKNIDFLSNLDEPVSLYRVKIEGKDKNWYNLFIFPLKTEHSESLVVMIDDITEFEKKDEQIRQIQKMESIGLLASGIAHDFNNILGGMLATVSLLKYRIKKGKITRADETYKDLEVVEKSCETGAAIASQLLNISRKEHSIEMHEADLNIIVDRIVKICRKSFNRSITITTFLQEEKASAILNTAQIEQSILNLCINAAHAMTIMRKQGEPHGGLLEIGIIKIYSDPIFVNSHYGAEEGLYWQLYVKDTGVGMDSNTISKVFDPFFTTKTGAAVQGTGLGLSIVYSIIRDHGGFIDVYSEPGLGTKFSLYLPVFTGKHKEETSPEKPEICSGEGTILIIDDEEVIRDYTEGMLIECGYTVLKASGGEEGTEIYMKNMGGISVVIIDMMMPGKSGFETLADLVKLDPEVRVIMTSGFHSKDLIDNAERNGAAGFIEKPYSMVQLSRKINSII